MIYFAYLAQDDVKEEKITQFNIYRSEDKVIIYSYEQETFINILTESLKKTNSMKSIRIDLLGGDIENKLEFINTFSDKLEGNVELILSII